MSALMPWDLEVALVYAVLLQKETTSNWLMSCATSLKVKPLKGAGGGGHIPILVALTRSESRSFASQVSLCDSGAFEVQRVFGIWRMSVQLLSISNEY